MTNIAIDSPLSLTMTTRLRHRPQNEDEDAAALKLGPGISKYMAEYCADRSRYLFMQNLIMQVVFSSQR